MYKIITCVARQEEGHMYRSSYLPRVLSADGVPSRCYTYNNNNLNLFFKKI